MPVDIDDLIRRERAITLEYDEETIEVRYKPHLFDSKVYNTIVVGGSAETDDEAFNVLVRLLLYERPTGSR